MIFISHSHKQREFAGLLNLILSSNGYETWLDTKSILGGDNFRNKIQTGLTECDCFIVVASSDAMKSEEVRDEIDWILNRRPRPEILVIRHKGVELKYGLHPYQFIEISRRSLNASFYEKLLRSLEALCPKRYNTDVATKVEFYNDLVNIINAANSGRKVHRLSIEDLLRKLVGKWIPADKFVSSIVPEIEKNQNA